MAYGGDGPIGRQETLNRNMRGPMRIEYQTEQNTTHRKTIPRGVNRKIRADAAKIPHRQKYRYPEKGRPVGPRALTATKSKLAKRPEYRTDRNTTLWINGGGRWAHREPGCHKLGNEGVN